MTSQIAERDERIKYLEELNRSTLEALDLAMSFGDFQNRLSLQELDHEAIFSSARSYLKRLIPFHVLALYLVDEADSEFKLTSCDPDSEKTLVEKEVGHQISDGVFAWALHQNRIVIIPSPYFGRRIVFHSLVTTSQIMGMFVGILKDRDLQMTSILSNLLTIIFFNTARSLENAILYKKIRDQNRNLEDIVHKRTAELEIALESTRIADNAKSQFLANMSHEIRTPMNGVMGFAELLGGTALSDEQADYVRMIEKSGRTLLSLINDVLDFSKIESQRLDLESVDFEPELVAYDVCELIQPRLASKPIALACRIGDHLPFCVKGDPHRFRQVLLNLLENAVKFTAIGEIVLSLDREDEQGREVKLHFTVRDSGIGIPEEKLTAIFEPFRQADGSSTRTYGGTGLGLSICKQLAKLMDGDVWAESALNQGSLFHFTAWFKKSEMDGQPRHFHPALSGKRVLLLDHGNAHRDILHHNLEQTGLRTMTSAGGREALSQMRRALKENDSFDFLIISREMPDLKKNRFIGQVRRMHREAIHLVVFGPGPVPPWKGRTAGFDLFLPAPVRRDRLIQGLTSLLQGPRGDMQEKTIEPPAVREHPYPRILLAEDNAVNRKLMSLMLEKAGYQVELAINGREVLDKVIRSRRAFDLIFMDVHMPEMDGIGATRIIREKGEHSVPIIGITASTLEKDRQTCNEAGMNDYLIKPVALKQLIDVIERWSNHDQAYGL